ncbi:hypothetical protein DQ353_09060 [Arthrobacter sp. AQ5-05]|nr:hypothetical protein DQ353_09060 [Arthrobacter sp. AQ5-05]
MGLGPDGQGAEAAALLCLPGWFAVAFTLTGAGYLVAAAFPVLSGREANRVAGTLANEAEATA